MRKVLLITGFLLINLAFVLNVRAEDKTRLDWQFKYRYNTSNKGNIKFLSVKPVRDQLRFDVVAHNTSKEAYECLYITATDKSIHLDDELGDEYPGIKVVFRKGLDNKLAINQRKRITIDIPKPSNSVDLVNVHFGFIFQRVDPKNECKQPLGNHGFNFHKLDWDVSSLRKKQ